MTAHELNVPSTSNATTDGRGERPSSSNFIRDIIDEDLEQGTYGGRVVTRFPPEPNGYLHIGHAKSICLNFGIAEDYDGQCHLRFDDTNPETEDMEYVESIKEAVHWLGFDWGDHLYYASDYFEQFYAYAVKLIKAGKAYVDSLDEEQIRDYRGSVTEPGTPSPYRDRSVAENLDLFEQMRAGAFGDGEHVLRAKIDMASPHMILRDPILYRIKHADHYRRGGSWCIYPMYDFAHPLEDAIEDVTHSLCTLEFDTNRALYDWVLEHGLEPEGLPARPRQYEFARLNLNFTIMSKRKLLHLVQEGYVSGWDDPRLPTIMGLRRRGVTPEAIRTFCEQVGVTRSESRVEISLLEHTIRDDLNHKAPRVMAVLQPLKVVITNYPEDRTEWLEADYWPRDIPREATRKVPFTRELYIERDDFMEHPTAKFYRLAPGREVRLRYGYFVTCDEVVKDDEGHVVELRCTYDPATRGGDAPDGRNPRATLHWVSAEHALTAEVRLYDRLFRVPDPDDRPEDFTTYLNPDSVVVLKEARIEPSVADDPADTRYQFERQGYFWRDPDDASPDALVFNRIVSLRDTWAKLAQEQERQKQEELRRQKEREKEAHRRRSLAEQRDPVDDFSARQRSRFDRLQAEFDLDRDDAAILAERAELTAFFEEALEAYDHPQSVANWIVNELLRELKDTTLDELPVSAQQLGALVALMDDGTISSRIAKEVFDEMLRTGDDPHAIVKAKGLEQVSDRDALAPIVDRLLTMNSDKVEQYREGKTGLLGFFMGQVMRETQGQADPELAKELLRSKLDADQ